MIIKCKRCIGGSVLLNGDGKYICCLCGAEHTKQGELMPKAKGRSDVRWQALENYPDLEIQNIGEVTK